MKMLTKSLTAITLSVIITAPIVAGTPALDNRQSNQKARIANGVSTGELTARESARMVKGQVELQRMENRAKRDGVVTQRERAKLQRKATIESGKIYRNKHDGQKREYRKHKAHSWFNRQHPEALAKEVAGYPAG